MPNIVAGHARTAVAALLGVALWAALPGLRDAPWGATTRALLAWDAGCVMFLVLVAIMFRPSRDSTIQADAARQEEGEWTVFAIILAATVASFAAILGEFSASKDMAPPAKLLHVGLVAATLLGSWLLTHTVFALRYAHEYYETKPGETKPGETKPRETKPGETKPGGAVVGGLAFPGGQPPDYWDFFYFSIVLGMTFQVSDVQIESREMRRLATMHGLLSFLFNTVILALSVNIASGLL